LTLAIVVVLLSGCAPAEQPAGAWECWGEVMLTTEMKNDYENKFATCAVRPARRFEIEHVVTAILKGSDRYKTVSEATGVPWFVVGAIHQRECDGRWTCHLYNGDPLTGRTVHAPPGRPLHAPARGHFPYTWEEAAIDALRHDGFDVWHDWSVGGTLYKLEAYNGFGYRNHGIPTAYLWAASQHYTRGKFVEVREGDGYKPVFRPDLVDQQLGSAVVLRRMVDEHLIDWPAPAAAPVPSPAVPNPPSAGAQ
jgi:lysozyme family protein